MNKEQKQMTVEIQLVDLFPSVKITCILKIIVS